jgi:MFS family permease
MYQISGLLEWVAGLTRVRAGEQRRALVPPNVVFLGLTSLFTDISSEMVVSILPIYLVGFLRMSPAQFGLLDGLYQGAAGAMQLLSGIITDRFRRYKEVAAVGYGASLLSRVGLLATTGATGIGTFLAMDRLGKGIRTAPRDALISLSVPRGLLGTAFGVHRAMDAMGAMIGPVLAFIILRAIPNGYDVVFVVSLCTAIIGLAVLALLVQNRDPTDLVATPHESIGAAFGLLRVPAFRHLALAALVLGTMTISDGFVYLTLQRSTGLSAGAFPVLYVATSAFYLAFAIPLGTLADRFGRFPVFLAGHVLLIALYIALAIGPSATVMFAVALPILGLYYAATEGVLMAVGSTLLSEGLRTTGLALLTTMLAVGRFSGSVLFGLLWTRFGVEVAVTVFLIGLAAAITFVSVARPTMA